MREADILKIVEDSFAENVSADGWLDDGIPTIVGKTDFLNSVKEKVKKLFEENDLSK